MLQYNSRSGELTLDGHYEGRAYSGHGDAINDPSREDERGVGPIPRGRYVIGPFFDHPRLGPCVAELTPAPGNTAFGRSEFFIHGDNSKGDRSASHGCIVAARSLRERIRDDHENDLLVV